ncbi:MAG: hypothetical protein IT291_09245 [Deltaproteobacteria bacterium]|nr:hypothetical protein [Deltaproteobacteria bacterium]
MIRKFQISIVLLSVLFCGCGVSGKAPARSTEFGAWITYWGAERAMPVFNLEPAVFGEALFFYGQLDALGQVAVVEEAALPRELLGRYPQTISATWFTVVNDVRLSNGKFSLKDPNVVHEILSSESLSSEHRQGIVDIARHYGFSGIDIDYENLWVEDRELFSNFIDLLAKDLHSVGLQLAITVQPKTEEINSDGAGAMDWERLCQSADRLQIMLYNLHSGRSSPGPISNISWLKEVMHYASSKCDKFRIIPVLKVVGREWGAESSRDIEYREVAQLIEAHNIDIDREEAVNGSTPYFTYFIKGELRTVYYEDAESLATKTLALRSLGYPHVIFWGLGNHDPSLHSELFRLRAGTL